MPRLPSVGDNHVILQTDTNAISPQVAAAPYNQIADALGTVGQNMRPSELDTAEKEGQNATYRDANGDLQVTTKPNNTATARAYNHAAAIGYTARAAGDIRANMQKLSDQANGNVNNFDASLQAYSKQIMGTVPEVAQGQIQTMLDQEASRSRLGVIETQRQRDISTFATDSKMEGQRLMDETATLARAGGTDTPDYHEKMGQLHSLYGQMVANPDLNMSQKQADIDLSHAESRNISEAMVGTVSKTLQTDGVVAARKQAQSILTDTSLELSPAERRQYSGIMDEAINGYVAQQKVAIKPLQDQSEQVQKLLDKGVGIDNPQIDDMIGGLASGGDVAGALKLSQARNSAKVIQQFKLASPAQRLQIAQSTMQQADGTTPTASPAAQPSAQSGQFSGLEQKYGLPAGYLAKTMQIESGGRNLSANSAGAAGYFQFIPSTAAHMNVDPHDLSSSSDGAARLAVENARALRSSLGRDPTAAELYLAHQQGSAGAAKLLSNPDANAASLVGTKAIIQNGGKEGMTAGQFAQMWANKFDGSKGATAVQSPGMPSGMAGITPQMVDAYRDGVTADARNYWSEMQEGVKRGYPPDPAEFALFAKQLAVVNDPNLTADVSRFMSTEAAGQAIAGLPAEQRAAAVSSLQSGAHDGATIAQQDLLEAAQRSSQQMSDALKTDPIGYASQRGITQPVPALDTGAGADAIGAALAARQNSVNLLQARGEVGNISALRPDDKTALGNFIQTAAPSDQAALLSTMAKSLSPDTYKATLADLAAKPDTQALAAAGALYHDNPDVAQGIIRGRALLRANANFAPKKDDYNQQQVDTILPPTAFGSGLEASRQQLLEAATARYADLSNTAGDTSGQLNSDRMTQAIEEVTGGVLNMNGDVVIAPQYGMKQSDFDDLIKNLPAGKLEGAVMADGTPIKPRDLYSQGRLKAVGDGQYLLAFGVPGLTPGFAQQVPIMGDSLTSKVSGGPFILDLRKK